jgi:hypothetical protein
VAESAHSKCLYAHVYPPSHLSPYPPPVYTRYAYTRTSDRLAHTPLVPTTPYLPAIIPREQTMPLHEGQQFPTFAAFKQAMQDWALNGESKFTYRMKKSDRTRCHIVCAHGDCPFRVYAGYSTVLESVVVSSIETEHTCIGAHPVAR